MFILAIQLLHVCRFKDYITANQEVIPKDTGMFESSIAFLVKREPLEYLEGTSKSVEFLTIPFS